jgi:hypothetical protein
MSYQLNWRVSTSIIFATPELSDKEQKNTCAVKQPVLSMLTLRKPYLLILI